jgi:hypothetical protein
LLDILNSNVVFILEAVVLLTVDHVVAAAHFLVVHFHHLKLFSQRLDVLALHGDVLLNGVVVAVQLFQLLFIAPQLGRVLCLKVAQAFIFSASLLQNLIFCLLVTEHDC